MSDQQDAPKIPTVEVPQGPIQKPEPPVETQTKQQVSDDQTPVIEVNNIKGLSITDKLLHAKGDISVQASTQEVNYLNFVNKKLQVHMGSATFLMDTPQLQEEQLRNNLSPAFYKLALGNENLLCFNQRNVSYFLFNENVVVVFKNGQVLRLTIPSEQREQIFSSFAEHHEMIIRSN